MMKRILVTGGAGFIGSHLCEELSKDAHNRVYSLDNYSTGSVKNHVQGVNYIDGCTKDISIHVNFKPDVVFHLGEYSRVEQSFCDIDKVWESNAVSILPVLEFVRKSGAKLVYAGSSTKFGDGGLGRNQSPYAFTKASNTDLIKSYSDWYELNYAIVYFYNAYGDREIALGQYATLVAKFMEQSKQGKALTVVQPGIQRRNFTHVKDIVSGLIKVGDKGRGDGYGIGSQESYSVLEIAKLFNQDIEWLSERKGNRMSSAIDTSKTEALGWKATHSIISYIESFNQQLYSAGILTI